MGNNIKIFTGLALLFVLLALMIRQCDSARNNDSRANTIHTERHDTLYLPGDTVWLDTIIYKPYPVYTQASTPEQKAANDCDSVRAYSDSLRIDSTSIVYYSDTVLGKKLTYRLTFSGKPYTRQITNTITDSIPYPVRSFQSGLYAIADAGGSLTQFNYSIGADYISKKKRSAGYRYGINQKMHKIKTGYKLF